MQHNHKKMKILYYNWVPVDHKNIIGGGVQIYQKNLIDGILNNNQAGDEIFCLSSGIKYNPFRKKAYIKKTHNIYGKKVHTFEIINSPILAPMWCAGNDINVYNNNKEILDLFNNFIEMCNGFDVIHINNFEGITPLCLQIKEKYPNIKIIFSVHNYVPICPRAQLFKETCSCICNNFHNGKDCVKCFCKENTPNVMLRNYIRNFFDDFYIPHFIINIIYKMFLCNKRIKKLFVPSLVSTSFDFLQFRKQNVLLINKYVDYVLAVSNKVRDICLKYGMNPDKVKTSYIGTKFADIALKRQAYSPDMFTIAYLGYARKDKGYFFMIDALSQLPLDITKKINVVIACKQAPMLDKLSKFNSVKCIPGYTHDELKDVLKDVSLGIVPVIWEDNLPQVAIEMIANGIPILCSNFGGASELCTSDLFKFNGGDTEDFLNKLKFLIKNKKCLQEYWDNQVELTTMRKHIDELYKYYGNKGDK